jgi:hypothetical protein
MNPLSCLTCNQRIARKRGNCYRCYTRHEKDVLAGKTTWAELEQKGLALVLKPRGHAWRK